MNLLNGNIKALVIAVIIVAGAVFIFFAFTRQGSSFMTPRVVLQNVPYDVAFKVHSTGLKVSETRELSVSVKKDGQPYDLLTDSVALSVALVSRGGNDFAYFDHNNGLAEVGVGSYSFRHVLKDDTIYDVWIEMNSQLTRDHLGNKADYVGHVELAGAQIASTTRQLSSTNEHRQKGYTVRLLTPSIIANQPIQLAVEVDGPDGSPVPLLVGVDHFYIVASPSKSLYQLDHINQGASDDRRLITQTLNFSEPGQYIFWIQLFTNIGNETQGQRLGQTLSAPFLITVTE